MSKVDWEQRDRLIIGIYGDVGGGKTWALRDIARSMPDDARALIWDGPPSGDQFLCYRKIDGAYHHAPGSLSVLDCAVYREKGDLDDFMFQFPLKKYHLFNPTNGSFTFDDFLDLAIMAGGCIIIADELDFYCEDGNLPKSSKLFKLARYSAHIEGVFGRSVGLIFTAGRMQDIPTRLRSQMRGAIFFGMALDHNIAAASRYTGENKKKTRERLAHLGPGEFVRFNGPKMVDSPNRSEKLAVGKWIFPKWSG